MSENYKLRVQKAMLKHHEREERKRAGPKRKNKAPEKDVQDECLKLMRSWGWSVEIYEAKATYDPKRSIYRQQAMKAGTVDCMGSTEEGIGAYVEFKAPGKLKTLRATQHATLLEKINHNCFACTTDSAEHLANIYRQWHNLRRTGELARAKEFLLNQLPEMKLSKDDFDLEPGESRE